MEKIHLAIKERVKSRKSIEEAIQFLRELDFYFLDFDTFMTFNKKYKINPKYFKYSVMTRGIKKLELFFLIKLLGNRTNKIIMYCEGKAYKLKVNWKVQKSINFKKMTIHWTFPSYMSHEQRREWRSEYRRLMKRADLKPSAYYLECLPDVQFLVPIEK